MNCISASTPVATTILDCDRITVQTPQRKARYSDPSRVRLKDIKAEVFKKISCSSSAEIKKYLGMIGVSLDLRLTAAWKAIKNELEPMILAAKAIASALNPIKPKVSTDIERLEQAKISNAIANFEEDSEGGMYWVWLTTGYCEIVSSTALPSFLEKQQVY